MEFLHLATLIDTIQCVSTDTANPLTEGGVTYIHVLSNALKMKPQLNSVSTTTGYQAV